MGMTLELARNQDILYEAKVSIATATTTPVISLPMGGGKRWRVYKMFLVFGAACSLDIQNGSTSLAGVMTFTAGDTLVLPLDQTSWFVGDAGSALNFVSTTAGTVDIKGRVYYTQHVVSNTTAGPT